MYGNLRILQELNTETYKSEPVNIKKVITKREVLIHSKFRGGNKINYADCRDAADCLIT